MCGGSCEIEEATYEAMMELLDICDFARLAPHLTLRLGYRVGDCWIRCREAEDSDSRFLGSKICHHNNAAPSFLLQLLNT